ncbi:ABC transporter substrate-binding protein [Enterovirga sp. CN4-39]|uniref:ABC transporter substrate-binding protein n=1 Tax=Enterovirga sp. CN4-39 TaxID=3400910 RepID=UPI003C0E6A08
MTALKSTIAAFALAASISFSSAHAQGISDGVVKIGVLTDVTGPYGDVVGEGAAAAARIAVNDCLAKECAGMKIEVILADHQNKPDLGLTIARKWIDVEKVDAFLDVTNSAIAIGVANLLKSNTHVTGLFSGPGTPRLTNDACVPNGIHWMYDTYALANSSIRALNGTGAKSIYFLAADYEFGQQLRKDAADAATATGIEVKGTSRHPLNTPDFSSFLLTAQSSMADAVAFANAGSDTINAVKQAAEFGLTPKQRLVALLMMLTDVHAIGLPQAQGLMYVTGFYSDLNERSKSFSAKFTKTFGRAPTMTQAAAYSAAYTYLKAVAATKTDDAAKVVPVMRERGIDDDVIQSGKIRPDGRLVHDMYLVQVKQPSESKAPWDYERLVRTVPGDEAFAPLSASGCPLVKAPN